MLTKIDAYNFLVEITGTLRVDRQTHFAIEKALQMLKPTAETPAPPAPPAAPVETDSAGLPWSASNPRPEDKEEKPATPAVKKD